MIMTAVNSLGSQNGRHSRVRYSRSGEHKLCCSVLAWGGGGDLTSCDYDRCRFPRKPEWSTQQSEVFQIRGAQGSNRVYVPLMAPRVVNKETNTPSSAFPRELFHSVRAENLESLMAESGISR